MAMHPSVAQHLDEIRDLAAEYGVEKLEIFGSAMTDAFDPERSDVDFIVHYPEGYVFGPFGKLLQDFEEDLTTVLGRPAQLLMTSSLRREHFRNNANKTRISIYDSDVSAVSTDPANQSIQAIGFDGISPRLS